MGKTVIISLDDFAVDQERNAFNWLLDFKFQYPDFKVTLFTILKDCPFNFLVNIKQFNWIQLAAHGFDHKDIGECLKWDKDKWQSVLDTYESMGFEKGFKAPQWEMNQLGYEMLKNNGWWVAVRQSQIPDLPTGMKYYCFETTEGGMTGHTWLMATHLKEGKFDWDNNTKFDFCSQHLEVKQ
jgi:hypothetical protein